MTPIVNQSARSGDTAQPYTVAICLFVDLRTLDDLQVVEPRADHRQRDQHHYGNDRDAQFQGWNRQITILATSLRHYRRPGSPFSLALLREYILTQLKLK